ncbi:NAD(P)H-dependent glycerol-3-phosphate dehydrogenase [Aquabacterium sp.]|uniref:NAD(P)H-dependent glycerol-3-phosphate dehydrogenase n=1 Tax=Aquabacterium sp. TaxID=1872578 RepID=UPI002487684F|nr:NAD(P)H-dependent glycerol-3-phosphate dehydrogenase [Aquabacterium sp.]MDI1257776.1 NAD(P)-dependent glycerol-3-phosphate dehydrogenase [Aquabacterium sp.]
MNLTVLGAGAWGTALAISAARHNPHVLLWARDEAQARDMQAARRNARYLPNSPFPDALRVTHDLCEAVAHSRAQGQHGGLVIIGTPMAALDGMLQSLPEDVAALWLCKGFEKGTGRLGHEIAMALRPHARCGVLSGPSFANEVAANQPTALVAASFDTTLGDQAVAAFHSDSLRVYTSNDPIGVEVGGAVKNVLAIATGIVDGMSLGLNARAALITRGLAEMTRLGVALGAQTDTFMGLSGLGDLVLTATGNLSRNRTVGLKLAEGLPLAQILSDLGHVAEGVYSAATVLQRAKALDVAMPITEAVVAVLEGRITPARAVGELMSREAKAETAGVRLQTPFE